MEGYVIRHKDYISYKGIYKEQTDTIRTTYEMFVSYDEAKKRLKEIFNVFTDHRFDDDQEIIIILDDSDRKVFCKKDTTRNVYLNDIEIIYLPIN